MSVALFIQTAQPEPVQVGEYRVSFEFASNAFKAMSTAVSNVRLCGPSPIQMGPAGVGVAEKTALVNQWDNTKLRNLATRFERQRRSNDDFQE
jgi:hypothetical protein